MTSTDGRSLRIGMVGYAFMGAAHSQAWRNAPSFFTLPMSPEMTAICGRNADAASVVAGRFGWQSVETRLARPPEASGHRPHRHLHPG